MQCERYHAQTLSNKKDKVFAHCLYQAEMSNLLFRHGCIATCGGKVIAKGCNTYKNYSSRDDFLVNCCSCHAEINVLRQIYYRNKQKQRKLVRIMKKTTLYISRYSGNGTCGDSAPCMDCLKVIRKYKIKNIIFHMGNQYYVLRANTFQTKHKTVGRQSLERKISQQQRQQ